VLVLFRACESRKPTGRRIEMLETNSSQDANRVNGNEMSERIGTMGVGDLTVIQNLVAAGGILPGQGPSPTNWTAEKKLAAAVLAAALVEIRDHAHNPAYRRRITEDLEWIYAEEDGWTFSFVRLCALFDLDVEWVRGVVAHWFKSPVSGRRVSTPYRQAA
jgi:hypothetical protein